MMNRLLWIFLMCVLCVGSVSGKERVAAFSLKTPDGKVVRLQSFSGKVIVLNFWATWCPPCVAEMPHLVKLQEMYGKKGVQVLGLSVDTDAKAVREFVAAKGVSYPVLMATSAVQRDFGGISGIPTTFILDRHLRVVDQWTGYRDYAGFEAKLKRFLK